MIGSLIFIAITAYAKLSFCLFNKIIKFFIRITVKVIFILFNLKRQRDYQFESFFIFFMVSFQIKENVRYKSVSSFRNG